MKTPTDRFNEFAFEHKLLDYDFYSWRRFISQLSRGTLIEVIEKLLEEMDCSRITKGGFQIISTTHYEYDFIVNNILRCLDRVSNPIIYNYYFDALCNLHSNNVISDERYIAWCEERKRIAADKARIKAARKKEREEKKNRKRMKDEYVLSKSTDLFEGTPKYIYSNLKTGDEIISDNPNLLEELNKPKKKKKDANIPPKMVSLPNGFSFNFNRNKKK